MNIAVRNAKEADLPTLATLLAQLFAIEEDFTADQAKQLKGLAMLLESPKGAIIVAQDDGKPVGMVTGQLVVSTAEGGLSCLVEDLVIDKAYRGKGMGSVLLKAVEEWAFGEGCTRLMLVADKDNAPAREFYSKAGWQKTNLLVLKKTERIGCLCKGIGK